MQIYRIASSGIQPGFDAAIKRAAEVADGQLGDNMLRPGMTVTAIWNRLRMSASAMRAASSRGSGITR